MTGQLVVSDRTQSTAHEIQSSTTPREYSALCTLPSCVPHSSRNNCIGSRLAAFLAGK